MRMRSPTSRGAFRLRFSTFDVVWAAACPVLTLYLRDVRLLDPDRAFAPELYCALAFAFSLIAFLAFRIRDGMTYNFSVHDALDVAKAVAVAELLTLIFLFTFTRLDGIPRSTPIIHALLLSAGLIGSRTIIRMTHDEQGIAKRQAVSANERIIVIGSTQLSALYVRMLEAYSPERQVVAVLDSDPQMIGRSFGGKRIVGPPEHLEPLIDELAEHGIAVDRVLIGGDPDLLSEPALDEVDRVCAHRTIKLDFVPWLIGLRTIQAPMASAMPASAPAAGFAVSRYHQVKRVMDLVIAVGLLIVLAPVFLLVGILALLDVGSPVLFWQQRLGMNGQTFLLHKFRTLKPSFDWQGQPIPNVERLSAIGRWIRRKHLDEIPQLLNILVGDMSLIGPRPLLPHDQPPNPEVRLKIRPGITGWAQVNGGTLLTPTEKDALDTWYVRNASFGIDLKIAWLTVLTMFQGERRSDRALSAANAPRPGETLDDDAVTSEPDAATGRA